VLRGFRVIDCSGELGWLCGRLLADLGADVIKVEAHDADTSRLAWQAYNVNKRLLRLDLGTRGGSAAFRALLARADILIESAPVASCALFDPEAIARQQPHLVHVSVTPFGQSGPHATWQASDLELMAAGGAMSLAGEPGGKPLRISVPQSRAWAGTQAASGALIALFHRESTGHGQHVDVSAQAAILVALAHAPTFVDILDQVPTRCGAFITGRTITGAQLRAFWPCRDGYINFVIYGGNAGRRSNGQLIAWMREAGADLGPLANVDPAQFDPKLLTQAEIDALEAPVAQFFRTLTKREFLDGASAREMLGYPVSTVADIAVDPQLEAREFWDDVVANDGTRTRHCGVFARIDGARAKLRHAPGTPISLRALLEAWPPPRRGTMRPSISEIETVPT